MRNVPDAPRDFLDHEIKVGDFIVYPTGGTSARMVLARVIKVNDTLSAEDLPKLQQYYKDRDAYDLAGRNNTPKPAYPLWPLSGSYGTADGYRGYARYTLTVNRYQEGTLKANDPSWWTIDNQRKVSINQLHRVVIVPTPEGL